MNPVLDARLEAVLDLIRADTHADIGSDHAHLPIRILRAGRASRCIAVELHAGPLAHSRRSAARSGLGELLDVRQGNGFDPLRSGEADSASMTGMGTGTIVGILQRAGDRLPEALVLQPNDSPRSIRQWALGSGYHLIAERLMPGYWAYPVLRLERISGEDPAYANVPLRAALRYGPHLLREGSPLLRRHIHEDIVRLTPLAAPGRNAQGELETAQEALVWLKSAYDDRT